jgi:RNA polymerase sigma factor (TIGR02999 family)
MSSPPRQEITRILSALGTGDSQAPDALLALVYDELRALAAARMAREPATATLQPTALVHEVYIRLVGDASASASNWQNRAHFFAAAAEAMRRILVDRARDRSALKRGGGWRKLQLDPAQLTLHAVPPELLDLDQALEKLAAGRPDLAELVKLRFFLGLSCRETAEVMGISLATSHRNWTYARAWLFQHLTAAERADSDR